MAVNDVDAAWGRFAYERDRVAKVTAGRDSAVTLVRGLPGWDGPTLQNIQDGAYFLPMVARTQETFAGLVFLKSPSRTFPAGLEAFTDDITQTGQEIDRFAEASFDAVLATGAIGVLVDYPPAPDDMTTKDREAKGFRPFLRLYDANSILEARLTKPEGEGAVRLTRVRLLESYEEDGDEEFTTTIGEQVRVLDLIDGVYRQRVFRLRDGAWLAEPETTPTMDGKPINEIPMFFSNTRDGEARCEKPTLADLADINIAHLNNSAQYEWALAWLGAPMLFGSGIKLAEGETIQMGASSAVITSEPNAKLEIVQADSEKFSGLKQAMDDKRRDAAALGARMLLETPKAAIAAETARIQQAGEQSVVGSVANAVSQCLTNSLRFLCKWAGLAETVAGANGTTQPILYWLQTDFIPTRMSPQELEGLLKAWQGGALSKRELFARFQEAEIVDPSKSFEAHEDEILAEMPDEDDDAEIEAAGGAPPAPSEEDDPPAA